MVGMMTTTLASGIEDPLQRLRAVHDGAVAAKAYFQTQGSRMMAEFAETVPGGIQAMLTQLTALAGLAERNLMMNTTVTNVPGPPVQLYMCGAQIIDSFGIGPLAPGMGLFHTVNSMVMKNKGTITLAFISCRDVLPDPEFYAQCIEESYAELRDAAVAAYTRPAGGKSQARRKRSTARKSPAAAKRQSAPRHSPRKKKAAA